MRVLHYASRSVATVALLALAAGCSGDSTAPDAPFDPAGTSSDVAAIDESFDAPALEAYAAASDQMSAVVGGSISAAIKASPSAALVRTGKAGALRYAASLAKAYTASGGLRPSFSTAAAAIPAEYVGVTFVYDIETDTYVASGLTGAPSNGVRFLLYAVNPVTGMPIEPLVEIGYADFRVTETATSGSVRAVVVSGGVTYLDYTVTAAGGLSSASITIKGYATNGTDRVNFDLGTTLSGTETKLVIGIKYTLLLPTRGNFRLTIEGTSTLTETTTVTTVDLEARGDHGTVTIEGTETDGAGTFDVEVNGDLLAVITVTSGGIPTIAGADGQPLSEAEQDAMWAIWYIFAQGFDFFEDLTDPIG
ncbi:MAG TPA: hypothetical protein VEB59_10050 [Gemmatimonadales bacterium]|nr:hypothetical protein [Gemmatimonadales bacterium]